MENPAKATSKRALALLQQGHAAEAEKLFLQVVALEPNNALALFNLGILAYQKRDGAAAFRYFSQAYALRPDIAEVGLAFARLLMELHRNDEAVVIYDKLLAAQPQNFSALCDKAAALLNSNQFALALASIDLALAQQPGSILALYNRATALVGLKRHAEAVSTLEHALHLKPDFIEALMLLGLAHQTLGQLDLAVAKYTAILALKPDHADAYNNRGSVMYLLKRYPESLSDLDRCLALKPHFVEALINRGRTLGKLGRDQEEVTTYNHVLALKPNQPDALASRAQYYLSQRKYEAAIADTVLALNQNPALHQAAHIKGDALMGQERFTEALAAYDQALAANPESIDAMFNRAMVLRLLARHEEAVGAFASVAARRPNYPYVMGHLADARRQCCDWADDAATSKMIVQGLRAQQPTDSPFSLLNHCDNEAVHLLSAKQFTAYRYGSDNKPRLRPAPPSSKIRIAYVSADFHNHATAHLAAGLFEAHDKNKFEITAVSFGKDDGSPMRERLKRSFDAFIDVAIVEDAQVLDMLRAKNVDIAVDLKGYTRGARPGLFINRIAPVQVNFLGYPSTMGGEAWDYIIADDAVLPPAQHQHFSERVVTLPDSYQPNDRQREIAPLVISRADANLPAQGFVFCSFNGNYKITPAVFDVWVRLLQQVQGSVLWLLRGSDASERNLRRELSARGVAPERLIFAPGLAPEHHRARHKLADLFLDTLPICAHTTASDALWAGLPMVTCVGSTFAGRVAASLLKAAGLPELVTTSLADYEALALKIATTPALLAELRAKLASHRLTCALFDTERYCRHLESAYATMHDRAQRGMMPEAFSVPAQSRP